MTPLAKNCDAMNDVHYGTHSTCKLCGQRIIKGLDFWMHEERMHRTPHNAVPVDEPRRFQASAPMNLRCSAGLANFRILAEPAPAAEGQEQRLPTFSMTVYTGGPIRPMGWWRAEPLIVDLAGMQIPNQRIPIDKDHYIDVGHTTAIRNDGTTLTAEGVLSGYSFNQDDDDDSAVAAGQIVRFAKNDFPWQSSMEGSIDQQCDFIAAGNSAVVNGQTVNGPVYVARATTLLKAAITSVGADGNTMTSIAAQLGGIPMNFETYIVANGFDPATISAQQRAFLKASHDAAQRPPVNPTPSAVNPAIQASAEQEENRRLAANIRRRNRITEICAANPGVKTEIDDPANPGKRVNVDIESHAIEAGWDETRTELEVLRCRRPTPAAPYGYVVNTPEIDADVITASVCRAGGLKTLDKAFNDKTLQAAHTLFPRGVGLKRLFKIVAQQGGYRGEGSFEGNGDTEEILRAAFGARFQASSGVSTVGLSGLLSNIANKFLLQGFMAVEDVLPMICSKRTVNDFKEVTSFRMDANFTFVEVGEDGSLEDGEIDEESYTNRARTYGIRFGISRKKLRNDDLDALSGVPMQIGRGGAEKRNLVGWTEFMANASTFYATDQSAIKANANYATGAGTALSIDALTQAEALFLNQVKPDGSPLAIEPKILLTPNAISVKARTYTRDQEIWITMSTNDQALNNPHAGKWEPVRSSYLSNALITGYSTAAWYLLADPAVLPVIEAAYLDGVETPMVETALADFNQLGVQMRGYFDFGFKKQNPRGGVKMAGA